MNTVPPFAGARLAEACSITYLYCFCALPLNEYSSFPPAGASIATACSISYLYCICACLTNEYSTSFLTFSIIDVTSYLLLTFVSIDYIVLKMETKYKRVSLDLIIIPILQYARSKEQDFNRSAQLSVKCKKALFFSSK